MDCFTDPVLMVDTGKPGWQLLHVNTAFEQRLGVSRQEALSKPFWELFKSMQYCEVRHLLQSQHPL
jgi:PAS domain-containing protein